MIPDTFGPEFQARAAARRETWSIQRYSILDPGQIKIAEYDFWAQQPAYTVMSAVEELTTGLYKMKGIHVSRLQRPYRSP